MRETLAKTALVVRERAYDWADVVLAAKLRGEWADLEAAVRQGLACVARAEATGEGAEPDAVDAAAQAFRYDRDLITAQETEAWLAARGLTVDAWLAYIERAVLRESWAEDLDAILDEYPPADDEVAALIEVEGVCSGAFDRFASALSARAAVYARLQEERAPSLEASAADVERLIRSVEDAGGVPGLSPESCRDKLTHLARLELAYRDFRARAITPRVVRDQLDARRLDWIRLDCRSLALPDAQAAREALLSVREDGLDLAAVAEAAKAEVVESRFYLEQAHEELRDHFLGGQKGDLLGPFEVAGEWVLFEVRDKGMPSEADPEIRERAEQAAWQSLVEREIVNRVRWVRPG